METSDEDLLGELEGLDITACKEMIARLQAKRERGRENMERMQEKLKALNYELAARKEEADSQKRRLQEEMELNKRAAARRRAARDGASDGQSDALAVREEDAYEQEMEQVRRLLEQQLNREAPRLKQRNHLGIREFDERDLMVEKPAEMEKTAAMKITTVLITHYKSWGADRQFHLSYRVDPETTCKKLREDACLYWGVSQVEFILWTMGNAKLQDDLTVQSCFKREEQAQVILAPKAPRETKPPERINDMIKPKIGGHVNRKRATSGQPVSATQEVPNENLYEQMAKLPGFFEFMTQRDRKVVGHLSRIRLGSTCVYATLALVSLLSFGFSSQSNVEFMCRLGLHTALTEAGPQAYYDIRSHDELWHWLTYSVSSQLLVNNSALRAANYLPGWLRIRMQHVVDASHDTCLQADDLSTGIKCFSRWQNDENADQEDLDAVEAIWQGRAGLHGRSNGTVPWRFLTREETAKSVVGTEAGFYQRFDGSGYAVDYNLQYENLTDVYQAYIEDMLALKSAKWISNKTRAVHLSFSAYNGNYDYWVSNWYLLELPAYGIVLPSSDVDVFRPMFDKSGAHGFEVLVLDTCRLALVFYILFCQISWEIFYESKHKQSWRHYILGPMGLADLGIVCIFLARYTIRVFIHGAFGDTALDLAKTLVTSFHADLDQAYTHRQLMILEAFFIALVIFRLLALLRINRQVFLVWSTLDTSMRRYIRYLLVFLPVLTGFVLVGHAVWRVYQKEYMTFWSSVTATLMLLVRGVSGGEYTKQTGPWMMIYAISFYAVVTLFFINAWVAILVQEYQKTRVAAGFRPRDYQWSEYNYVSWCLYSPVKKLYCKARPGIEPEDA